MKHGVYLGSIFHYLVVLFQCGLLISSGQNAKLPSSFARIRNGSDSEPHAYPYMCIIRSADGHLCGGTILDSQWVLTAAHCCNTSINYYRVTAGEFDLASFEGTEQTVRLQEMFLHPDFDPEINWQNDIALLLLQKELEFSPAVQPVSLEPLDYYEADTVTILGWGNVLSDDQDLLAHNILQEVENPIIDQETCVNSLGQDILDSNFCMGSLTDADFPGAGDGDSGGPVICSSTYYGIEPVQCGIVSTRSISTRITSFLPFIKQTMEENSP